MSTAAMIAMIGREEAAKILGVSPGTLANWQSTGFRRVPHVKIGKRVRYRVGDLEKFIEQNLVNPIEGDGASERT